ncbi:hypothetical protein S58_16740 [Bradyrhizobium oligotrophicum S58]|uniref:Uncharacterized protein n=1 Tax=Bradyrhizobium oligotrophicum S58 TaxID=1245469 RepID=M4Z439_9BRAD|nr:hypothetical protein [Bradyrhizobium oligotrophicum]BAM87682.1 hypothetical protein S58_16740 [Bradyrhizobium oligotrophicum S58]
MAHPRKLIRAAFVDRLKTALDDGSYRTRAQGRVYKSRLAPISEEELKEDGPAILVYARMEETSKPQDYGVEGDATHVERNLTLVTEAMLLAGNEVDDALDDMAEAMEAAIDGFMIPGFESAQIRLMESDIDVVTEQVKRPVGAIGLIWNIRYRTNWRARASASDQDAIEAFLRGE